MGFVRRFKNYNKFFGFTRAIKNIFIDSIARISGGMIVYSQSGEDLILAAIFQQLGISPWGVEGFYVDVGCNHPISCSNTFFYYKLGWSGIVIDANPDVLKKYPDYRPLDIIVNSLVSNDNTEKQFTRFNSSLVSSVDKDHVSKWSENTNSS